MAKNTEELQDMLTQIDRYLSNQITNDEFIDVLTVFGGLDSTIELVFRDMSVDNLKNAARHIRNSLIRGMGN